MFNPSKLWGSLHRPVPWHIQCGNKLVVIFLIFEDILVINASHHHMKYTGARFLPRLSWHIVRLSCQFRLMSLTCPPGICPPGIRRLPDNAILHGNQTGCLYGHWYHSFAHLSRTQSVPHRQDGCNSHKCEFLSKKRDVVMLFYRRIVKKAIKCFVISKQIITFAPTK